MRPNISLSYNLYYVKDVSSLKPYHHFVSYYPAKSYFEALLKRRNLIRGLSSYTIEIIKQNKSFIKYGIYAPGIVNPDNLKSRWVEQYIIRKLRADKVFQENYKGVSFRNLKASSVSLKSKK